VTYAEGVEKEEQLILVDAQTSGGLLVAVDSVRAASMLGALASAGVKDAAIIGEIGSGEAGKIIVTR
jgi:selenide,water dikinase